MAKTAVRPKIIMQEVKDNQQNAIRWAELMAQYVGIQELTAENLNFLVKGLRSMTARKPMPGQNR